VNADIGSKKKTFVVIGDVESLDVCSKWFRIKCLYCGEYFQLCPPKKNVESNLQNHVNELKHSKAVDDHCIKGAGNAFLTGRPGRPSKSSNSADGSQQSLHVWSISSIFFDL
jgi:hypothetical protein